MINAAQRQASLEAANEIIEQKVIKRTARLEVTQVLAEATTVREALPRVLRAASESLGWDVGAFWVVDRGDHVLHCLELWHAPVLGVAGFEAASRAASFAPGVGLPGRVWSGGQPVWIPDVTADPNFPRAPLAVQEGLHGAFACPVRVEGEILGVIEFFSRRVQQPDEDLLEMMATIGGQIGQFMERRRAEEGLRRSEARKAAILEAALDCIITVDHEERILEFNPAAERSFGHARDAVLGQRMGELIVPPRYREAHRRGLQRYLATGEGPVLGRRIEMPALRADGTEFPAEISIVPTVLDGQPIFTGYLRDITEHQRAEEEILALNRNLERRVEERTAELAATNTRLQAEIAERRQVEEELRRAQQAAERTAKAKDEFLAMISHELRTPLNGVIGMVDLLSESDLDGQQQSYAQVARTSADLLLGIIDDILDLSRIESGRLELDPVDFNPAEVVEDVAAMLALRAEEKGLELACQVQPEVDVWVCGDRGRLRQALTNLMANAIKFTDRGEVVVRAEAEARAEAQVCLRFTISDTGIGIDPDGMGRLFQPFSQADASTSRRYGGSGLGLAISRHLAQAMGGQIGAESVPGRGSTFWFTVVMEPAPPDATAAVQSPLGLQGRRALIVDDNTTNRQILHEQLASFGIVSAQVSGGPEALAQLEEAARSGCPFELAILDLHMPGMDGVQLGRRHPGQLAAGIDRPRAARLDVPPGVGRRAEGPGVRRLGCQAGRPAATAAASHHGLRGDRRRAGRCGGPLPRPARGPDGPGARAQGTLGATGPRRRGLEGEPARRRRHAREDGALGPPVERRGRGDRGRRGRAVRPDPDGRADARGRRLPGGAAIRTLEAARGTRTPIVAVTAHAVTGDRERCLAAGMDAYLSKPLRRQELARIIDDVLAAGPVRAPTEPEHAPEARSTRAILDREVALARLEGDEALFAELVAVYLEEWPKLFAKIRVELAAGDLLAVGHQAHRLCGLAKTFDAHEAADAAARLEGVSAVGDRAAVADAAAEVGRSSPSSRTRWPTCKAHGRRGNGEGPHHASPSDSGSASPSPTTRSMVMPSCRIFLRRLFRAMPRICAARAWLPRAWWST